MATKEATEPSFAKLIDDLIKQWLPLLVVGGIIKSQMGMLLIPILLFTYQYAQYGWMNRVKPVETAVLVVRTDSQPNCYGYHGGTMKAVSWYLREHVRLPDCAYAIESENYHCVTDPISGQKSWHMSPTFSLDSCPAVGTTFRFQDQFINLSLTKINKNNNSYSSGQIVEMRFSSRIEDTITKFIDTAVDSYNRHLDTLASKVQMTERYVYVNSGDTWAITNPIIPKTFDNVFLDDTVHRQIITDLDTFLASEEFYRKAGAPYKRSYLLHGPPGTGKSSTYYAAANHTKRHLYKMSLADVTTDNQFKTLIKSIPAGSILAIDDVDRIPATCGAPATIEHEKEKDAGKVVTVHRAKCTVGLSTFLEVFDGYDYLNKCIIFFTSNFPEKLDPAFVRPGRADLSIEIQLPTQKTIRKIVQYYFPKETLTRLPECAGKKSSAEIITRIIMPNRTNFAKCLELLANN